jgi:hypothetical protein
MQIATLRAPRRRITGSGGDVNAQNCGSARDEKKVVEPCFPTDPEALNSVKKKAEAAAGYQTTSTIIALPAHAARIGITLWSTLYLSPWAYFNPAVRACFFLKTIWGKKRNVEVLSTFCTHHSLSVTFVPLGFAFFIRPSCK